MEHFDATTVSVSGSLIAVMGTETAPIGLDTLCFYFCLLFYSLMLSSHAYYMLLKLTYSSQIMLKKFSVHRQNISFSIVLPPIQHWMYHETSGPMCAHALNGGPHIIITSSCGEGLGQAYYSHWSKDFSSINASQCLLFPKLC